MTFGNWRRWLNRTFKPWAASRRQPRRHPTRRPHLEMLEDRIAPATHTWQGGAGATGTLWSVGTNWVEGTAPTEAHADVIFGSAGLAHNVNTNDLVGASLGTITFNSSTYSISGNAITLSGGISDTAASGTDTFSPDIMLTASQTVSVANSGAQLSLGGQISDVSGQDLTKDGAGKLVLSNATNGYGGNTIVSGGVLAAGVANALPAGTTLVVNSGAVFDLNGFSQQVAAVTGAGTVTDSGAAATFTVSTTADDSFSGSLTGSLSLTKDGAAKLTLAGTANTFTGTTTVKAGTLLDGAAGALPTGTALTVNGTGTFDLNGFSQQLASLSGTGTVTDGGAAATLTLTTAADDTFGGTLSGTLSLAKAGAAELTLTVANTYTGGTTVSAGTLADGVANALPTGTALTVSGGTFDLSGFGQQLAAVLGTGTVTDSGAAATLTVTTSADDTFGGTLAGSLSLVKAGAAKLTLGAAGTYTGSTMVSAGTLLDGVANALPTATALTVSGGTFDLGGFNQQLSGVFGTGTVTDGGAAATLTLNTAADDSFGGTLSGSLSLAKAGAAKLTLTVANTYTGGTTVSAGTLTGGVANALPTTTALTVSGGTFDLSGFGQQLAAVLGTGTVTDSGAAALFTVNTSADDVFGGTLTGSLSLVKTGAFKLTLGLANSYTGTTAVNGGTLADGAADALPAGGTLTVAASGVFDLNGFSQHLDFLSGSGTVTDSSSTAATLTLTTAVDNTFNGTLAGNLSLAKAGAAKLTLGTANTYSGGTTVSAGTLTDGVANALPTATALTVSGGTFDLSGFGQQVASLSGTGTVTDTGAAAALTVSTAFDDAFNGTLTGSLGLTKAGAAKLTLGTANTYTGGTTVSGGTLADGAADALPAATALTVSAGTTFDLAGFDQHLAALFGLGTVTDSGAAATLTVTTSSDDTFNGTLAGNLNLAKAGAAKLTLGAANTYTGSTTVSAGTLADGVTNALPTGTALTVNTASFDLSGFSQQVASLSGTGTVTDSGAAATLTVFTTADDSFGGTFSGSLSLAKAGAAKLTLGTANTYTGSTTVNAGTLADGVTNALPTGTALTVNTATFALNGFSQQLGGLAGKGTVTDSGAAATLTVSTATDDTFAGTLSGSLALTKSGPARLTLSGAANTYTGLTTVTGGTLADGVANALPTATALTVSGATFDLGGFDQQVASLSGTGTVTNSSATPATLTVNVAAADTFNGTLTGNLNLAKAGAGVLTLGTANTYTGGTTVNSGTLADGVADALPTTTVLTVSAGTTFDLAGFDQHLAALAGPGTVTDSGAAATLTVNTPVDDTFGGKLSGSLSLVKDGAARLTLTGPGTNFTGTVTVARGTLLNGVANALPTASTFTVNSAAFYDLNGFNQQFASILGNGTITNTSPTPATLTVKTLANDTFPGRLTGNLGLTKDGPATLTLTGAANDYTGTTAILAGTLVSSSVPAGTVLTVNMGQTFDLNGASLVVAAIVGPGTITNSSPTLATLTVNNTTLDDQFVGTLSGNLALAKTGGRTLILTGTNTYTGGTTVTAGTVAVSSEAGLGNAAGAAAFTNATLEVTTGFTSGRAYSVSNAAIQVDPLQTFTVTGTVGGAGGLTKTGAGTLALTGTNSYGGGTTLAGGTLQINSDASLGGAGNPVQIINNSILEATATFSSGRAITFGPNAPTILDQGQTIQVDTSQTLTLGGGLTGPSGLNKTGPGTLVVSGGANTYAGATQVNGGTLLVNGAITSAVTVNNLATLGGSGTVGAITAISGGTVSPGPGLGAGTGTLTATGNVLFTPGSTFAVELNGRAPGAGLDQLVAGGTVNLGGANLNALLGPGFLTGVGDAFTVIKNNGAGAITGTFAGATVFVPTGANGQRFQVAYNAGATGKDVVVTHVNTAPFGISFTLSSTSISKGGTVTLTNGVFTDPDTQDTHVVAIDWGDGKSEAPVVLAKGVFTFAGGAGVTHQYLQSLPNNRPFNVTVTVTDRHAAGVNDASGSATQQVFVANTPPRLTNVAVVPDTPGKLPVLEGDVVDLTGNMIDVGTDSFVLTVNWGDTTQDKFTFPGAAVPNTAVAIQGVRHTYLEASKNQPGGVYTVTVTVTNPDGIVGPGGTATVPVAVNDAPPLAVGTVLFLPVPGPTPPGGDRTTQLFPAVNVALASFSDQGNPEANRNYTATIDWNDPFAAPGADSQGTIAISTGDSQPGDGGNVSLKFVLGTHTYSAAGAYTVTVTLRNGSGDVGVVQSTVIAGSSNEVFVDKVFKDIVGRAPERNNAFLAQSVRALGSSNPDQQLSSPAMRSQITVSLLNSQEALTKEVNDIYNQLLHRDVDVVGLSTWLHFLSAGGQEDQLRAEIMASQEYFQNAVQSQLTLAAQANHGLSSAEEGFVRQVYMDALGRTGFFSDGGVGYWVGQLQAGVSRSAVAESILHSAEGLARAVNSLYLHFLRRSADPTGSQMMVAFLTAGHTFRDAESVILSSSEFLASLLSKDQFTSNSKANPVNESITQVPPVI
jgi:autotransporter-associated beta strand protein